MDDNPSLPIEKAIETFLKLAGAKSEHTQRTYGTALRHFTAYLIIDPSPPLSANDLTLDHARRFATWLVSDYQKDNGTLLSKRGRAVYLVALGRFYNHLMTYEKCIKVDYVDYEGFKDFLGELIEVGKRLIKGKLPKDDMVVALIEAQKHPPEFPADASEKYVRRHTLIWRRDLAIILSLYSSGMRVGELCSLKRGDLDYEEHTALVIGKEDKQREVDLSGEAWAAIMAYLNERKDGASGKALESIPLFCRHDQKDGNKRSPLSTHAVRRLFTRLAENTGIAEKFNLTPHSLRHYFATRFLEYTGDLALTQDALGHADPRTTRVYAKTNRKTIKEAHQGLFKEK